MSRSPFVPLTTAKIDRISSQGTPGTRLHGIRRNERTARLLTTLILHQAGYGLKGIYSLEKYDVQNMPGYYEALAVGQDYSSLLRQLDPRQRRLLDLFRHQGTATAGEMAVHLSLSRLYRLGTRSHSTRHVSWLRSLISGHFVTVFRLTP